MLRLDWTADQRVPDCLRAEDFQVRFGAKLARITKLSKMNEGWCALDVLVPKGATSAGRAAASGGSARCEVDEDCNGGAPHTESVCGNHLKCITGCHVDDDCAEGTSCSHTTPTWSCR